MREILFRGKDIDTEEWVYGYYSACEEYGDNGGVEVYYKEKNFLLHYITDIKGEVYIVDTDTVGQYTGLTDKNGKKIFEGDVVKCFSIDGTEDWFSEVYSDGNSICINVNCCDYDYTVIDWAIGRDIEDLEVIGNIHDNLELLDKGDE